MNNTNTANATDDVKNVIPIVPMYYYNVSNVSGGNQNVVDLTDDIQVIEDNQIGKNTRKNYFLR